MANQIMSKSTPPATEALETALNKRVESPIIDYKEPMICTKNLKRSRSTMGSFESFDMSDFAKASQQVEESIAFPTIEWPDIDDSEEDNEPTFEPTAKRRCRGLVRSKNSCNLFELGSTQRLGSAGSLC
jgi:hypothetical protein